MTTIIQEHVEAALDILKPAEDKRAAAEKEIHGLCEEYLLGDLDGVKTAETRAALKKLVKSCAAAADAINVLGEWGRREVFPLDEIGRGDYAEKIQEIANKLRTYSARAETALPNVPLFTGAPRDDPTSYLVFGCLDIFDMFRPGEAKISAGDFPAFCDFVYQAVGGDENRDLFRYRRWAFDARAAFP